jgi:hypothetical protein
MGFVDRGNRASITPRGAWEWRVHEKEKDLEKNTRVICYFTASSRAGHVILRARGESKSQGSIIFLLYI